MEEPTKKEEQAKDGQQGPFWQSRKLWYTAMALGALLALALSGTVSFSSEQVMTVIIGVLGVSVGGHAATDIAALVARRGGRGRDGDQIPW